MIQILQPSNKYASLFLNHFQPYSHSHRHDWPRPVAMQYETSEGHCVVAPLRCRDQRLQQFVARSFREELGRESGALHVNVRQYVAGQLGMLGDAGEENWDPGISQIVWEHM